MAEIQLDETQAVIYTVEPLKADDSPGTIEGDPVVEIVSGNGRFTVPAIDPNTGAVVPLGVRFDSEDELADTVFRIKGDALPGRGEVFIEDLVTVRTVPKAAEATASRISGSFGTPFAKGA